MRLSRALIAEIYTIEGLLTTATAVLDLVPLEVLLGFDGLFERLHRAKSQIDVPRESIQSAYYILFMPLHMRRSKPAYCHELYDTG